MDSGSALRDDERRRHARAAVGLAEVAVGARDVELLRVRRTLVTELPWSRLEHVRLLSGAGGSCEVYSAVIDGEPVAVKKVRPAFAQSGAAVRDLLARSDAGTAKGSVSATVASHDIAVFKLTPA